MITKKISEQSTNKKDPINPQKDLISNWFVFVYEITSILFGNVVAAKSN